MARISLLLALCAVVAGVVAAGAVAITNGEPDGDRHPYAAALVVGGRPACSAALVSPTVAVTAAHCVVGLASPRVALTFEAQLDPASWSLFAGTAHADPQFGVAKSDLHDLAVVVLDAPAPVRPALLPSADASAAVTATTAVGYGYYGRAKGEYLYDGVRRLTTSDVKKVGASTLTVDGGVCFGDSGGPHLLGDVVVAITSTGTSSCSGPAQAYRLDTPSARAFLAPYVDLP